MDALRRYDELFSRLLFDRAFRERLRAGDWSECGAETEAFSTVNLDDCEKLSIAIRDGLVGGSLGGLAIGHAFPQTCKTIAGAPAEAVEAFLAAHMTVPAFDGTCRRAGVSVFESFYRWAEGQLIHKPDALLIAQHEFAAGLFRVLASKPNPGFRVEWPLARTLRRGWYCVLDAARPLLSPWDQPQKPVGYLAALGQYVSGLDAIEFSAIVFERTVDPPPWAVETIASMDPATAAELRGVLSSLDDDTGATR